MGVTCSQEGMSDGRVEAPRERCREQTCSGNAAKVRAWDGLQEWDDCYASQVVTWDSGGAGTALAARHGVDSE
jgi:hypothetical protein